MEEAEAWIPVRWQVIAAATAVLFIAYWIVLFGLLAPAPGPLVAGLALVPIGLYVLARPAGRPHSLWAMGRAFGISLSAGVVVSLVAGEVVTGITAAYAIGAALVLPAPGGAGLYRAAAASVLIVTVWIVLRVATLAGVVAAPLLPVFVVAWADRFASERQESSPGPG